MMVSFNSLENADYKMKKLLCFGVLICTQLLSTHIYAKAPVFTHKGIQKEAMFEGCYHNPCSVAKVTNFKQLSKTATSSMVELTLLGGSRDWNSKKIAWGRRQHKVFITCSIQSPTVTVDDQVTIIPINANGVPGVLYNDYQLYMQTCHNFYGSEDQAMKKFGYNVSE